MLKAVQRALLLVFLSCLFIAIGSSKAQKEPEKNYIKVKGIGVVSKEPDVVYVNLTITTLEKSAKEAYEVNDKRSNELIQEVKKIGLSSEDFTNNFSLSESHDRQGKRIGFSATNSLKVTISNFDLATKLIDIAADFVTGSSVTFAVKDYKKASLESLDSAFSDAKKKADVLAQKSGLRLGDAVSIDEDPEHGWGLLGGSGYYRADGLLHAEGPGPLVLNPQKVNVTSSIVVIFEVKNK